MPQIVIWNNGQQEAHTITDGPNEIAVLDEQGKLNQSVIPNIIGSGVVVQVVSITKTDTFNGTVKNGNWIDIEGLCGAITPNSASSKILISCNIEVSMEKIKRVLAARLVRNGLPVCVADADGDRETATSAIRLESDKSTMCLSFSCQDEPNSTSELIYKIQMSQEENKNRTIYINRTKRDKDEAKTFRVVSNITLTEISG